jgi:hypothetical protein
LRAGSGSLVFHEMTIATRGSRITSFGSRARRHAASTTCGWSRCRAGGAVRALLCNHLCNCHFSMKGADDDELVAEVLADVRRDHPAMPFPEERVREFVTSRAYNVEYVAVYADGEGPDEDLGPEPY